MSAHDGFIAKISLPLCLLLFVPFASAEVYKCVDEVTGKMTFTDTACPDKTAGGYVPVGTANRDSGYTSGRELQRIQDERRRAEKANVQKWIGKARAVAEANRVEAHKEKADRLDRQAGSEKDFMDRSLLRKQAKLEREAANAGGNDEAERHYKQASKQLSQARNARSTDEKFRLAGQAKAEQNAARAAAGLPPVAERPAPDPNSMIDSAPAPDPNPMIDSDSDPASIPDAELNPRVISKCDTYGCWDSRGKWHQKAGGNNYNSSDGKKCQSQGDFLHCN